MKKVFFKTAVLILIQMLLLSSAAWGRYDKSFGKKDTLSPQLNMQALFLHNAYLKKEFPWPNVIFDAVDKVPNRNNYSDIEKFRTVLIDGLFSSDYLQYLINTTPNDTLPLPWSLEEVKMFAVYLPSLFNKIEQNIGKEELFSLTGAERISEQESIVRIILQLQSELSSKIATLDSFIIENRGDDATLLNKIYVYNRMTTIMCAAGLLSPQNVNYMQYEIPVGNEQKIDILIDIKKRLLKYLEIVPIACRENKCKNFKAALTEKEKARYGYVPWIKEKLGNNLRSIVLYGSAAREEENYNDYDNWVVVEDLDKAYAQLRGIGITFHEGRVLVDGQNGKEVSLNLVPADLFARMFRFNSVCDRNLETIKVLYGSIDVYDIDANEIMERSISGLAVKLKSLRSSAAWISRNPEMLDEKPALFNFFIKNTRFALTVCLNYKEGLDVFSKELICRRLKELGIETFEYKDDLQYLNRAIIQTIVDSAYIFKKYLIDRKSDFSFIEFAAIDLKTRNKMLKKVKEHNTQINIDLAAPKIKAGFPQAVKYEDFLSGKPIVIQEKESGIKYSFLYEGKTEGNFFMISCDAQPAGKVEFELASDGLYIYDVKLNKKRRGLGKIVFVFLANFLDSAKFEKEFRFVIKQVYNPLIFKLCADFNNLKIKPSLDSEYLNVNTKMIPRGNFPVEQWLPQFVDTLPETYKHFFMTRKNPKTGSVHFFPYLPEEFITEIDEAVFQQSQEQYFIYKAEESLSVLDDFADFFGGSLMVEEAI